MARGRAGARYYNGQELLLSGRHTGLNARADASTHAKRLRKSGHWARIVKISEFDYTVYSLLNEKGA